MIVETYICCREPERRGVIDADEVAFKQNRILLGKGGFR
jgi:hypothetical protein